MARIPLDHPRTPLVRLAEAYSRRTYGQVLEPGLASQGFKDACELVPGR